MGNLRSICAILNIVLYTCTADSMDWVLHTELVMSISSLEAVTPRRESSLHRIPGSGRVRGLRDVSEVLVRF